MGGPLCWFAMVNTPGPDGRVATLNSIVYQADGAVEVDPLHGVPDSEPELLLQAMNRLIDAGVWPQSTRRTKEVKA